MASPPPPGLLVTKWCNCLCGWCNIHARPRDLLHMGKDVRAGGLRAEIAGPWTLTRMPGRSRRASRTPLKHEPDSHMLHCVLLRSQALILMCTFGPKRKRICSKSFAARDDLGPTLTSETNSPPPKTNSQARLIDFKHLSRDRSNE